MILSMQEILNWCETEHKALWEYMLHDDMQERKVTREASMATTEAALDVMMETTASYREDVMSASGLVGNEGGKLEAYRTQHTPLCGEYMGAAMVIALKMAESNACMRRIVAAPTAGSCGVIPAVLIPYYQLHMGTKKDLVKALYVAGAIGEVIARRASISGAAGGCQAEIGAASAMACGALVFLRGGSNEQICHGAALALKGLLGLVCDPVAGLVEIPCVKRNVLGAVNAISCTDMVMAGIESKIPVDEVIDAMGEIGAKMDVSLRETSEGGLATTPTAMHIMEQTNTP